MKLSGLMAVALVGFGLLAIKSGADEEILSEKYIKFTNAGYGQLPIADRIRIFMGMTAAPLSVSPTGELSRSDVSLKDNTVTLARTNPKGQTTLKMSYASIPEANGFTLFRSRENKRQFYEGLNVQNGRATGAIYCGNHNKLDCQAVVFLCSNDPVECVFANDAICSDLGSSFTRKELEAIESSQFAKGEQSNVQAKVMAIYDKNYESSKPEATVEKLKSALMKGFKHIASPASPGKVSFNLSLKENSQKAPSSVKVKTLVSKCLAWNDCNDAEKKGKSCLSRSKSSNEDVLAAEAAVSSNLPTNSKGEIPPPRKVPAAN
jgi:hypothetical protein